ncbi:MAG: hypothetical protein ACYTHJ_06965 [Planctomycetota bacterium]|jgi:hypothetical protein
MTDSKRTTLTAIMELNPTAETDFLEGFSYADLQQYLGRLRSLPYRMRGDGSRCIYDCEVNAVKDSSPRGNPVA